MRIRMVVANQTEARFYDTFGRRQALVSVGVLTNPSGRQHDQDLDADRPGRTSNGGVRMGGRRGASPRRGTDGERSTRQHMIESFARRIGAELEKARAAHRFDRVVLVAEPGFLGRLRKALPATVRALLAASVAHDLVNQPAHDPRDYLPSEVFTGGLGFQVAKRATARNINQIAR
jgi:protein required for attachment to host cells